MISHTEARGLGFVAASCGSLSTELTGAGFHTETQSHGAWVLYGASCGSLSTDHQVQVSHGGTEARSLGLCCSVRWESLRVFIMPLGAVAPCENSVVLVSDHRAIKS